MRSDDDDDSPTVPLFGVPDEGDEAPRRHSLPRCRNCLEALRDDARYCDRCGAEQDGTRGREANGTMVWPVLVVGLLVGLLIGGAATVAYVSNRIAEVESDVAAVATIERDVAALRRELATVARQKEVVYVDRPASERVSEEAPVREPVTPAPEPTIPPPDSSPSGLRERFGPSVLEVRTRDDAGEELDVAPCFAVGARRVVTSLAVLAGASSAVLVGSDGAERTITGVVGHDTAFDIAVLEVAEPAAFAPLTVPFTPPQGPTAVTLLGSASRSGWREATARVVPGASDRITGAPRYAIEPAAKLVGVALDSEGKVLALVTKAGALALPSYAAAPLARDVIAATPLEFFLRSSGPGAPSARLKRVRQLLDAKRLDEAVRLMLGLTAEEPRLIADVAEDLAAATLEIARGALASGSAATADPLLAEVLLRLPENSELWAARGRGIATFGDVTTAVACLKTAAAKAPAQRDDLLKEAVGLVLDVAAQRKAQGLVNDAIQLLLEQRRQFPESGALRAEAGQMLMESRRFDEAATIFGEAALVDPKIAGEMRSKAERARDLAGGPGAIIVDYQPGESKIVVNARLNGSASVRLLLDQGETHCVVPTAAVTAAGYSIPGLPRQKFHTDPNEPEVPTVQLGTVVIGNATTQRVPVVVVDNYSAPYADGVLGQPFLSRFRRVEDSALGRLVLYPR